MVKGYSQQGWWCLGGGGGGVLGGVGWGVVGDEDNVISLSIINVSVLYKHKFNIVLFLLYVTAPPIYTTTLCKYIPNKVQNMFT